MNKNEFTSRIHNTTWMRSCCPVGPHLVGPLALLFLQNYTDFQWLYCRHYLLHRYFLHCFAESTFKENKRIHFYRPQKKLREGNVFTPVCQSFCSEGEGVSWCHFLLWTDPSPKNGIPPKDVTPYGQQS